MKSVTTTTTKKPTTTTTTTTTTKIAPSAQEIEYYDDEDYEVVTPSKAVESSTKAVEISTLSKPIDRSAFFLNRGRSTIDNLTPSSTVSTLPTQNNFRLNRFKTPNEKSINEATNRENTAQKVSLSLNEEISQPKQTTTKRTLSSFSYSSKKFANQQTVFDPTTTESPKLSSKSEAFNIDQRFFSRNAEQSEPDHLEEKDQKYVMRVIKRPFLPSRGGNPYKGRGLQPVGPASLQADIYSQFSSTGSELSPSSNENTQSNNDHKTFVDNSDNQQYRGKTHKTTLDDIYNEEFDVELNDALNPMLKPLTSSRGISGFSFSSLPIDDKDGYRSQSQRNIQTAEAPKTSTTTTTEQPQYEYEEVEYDYV